METGNFEDAGADWRSEEELLMAWIHKENAIN
jgi:hypothetical protein